MFRGLVLLALVVTFGVQFGVEGFEIGRFEQRNMTSLCVEKTLTPVSCEAASADGILAHPDDCRLFYKCPHGAPVCVPCPAGLHFNPTLRVCDQPGQAGCDLAEHSTESGDGTSGNNIPQRCIDKSVTPVSCALEPAPDSLLAHPDDCELFYYCVSEWSEAVCRQCPAGLHFNPVQRVCDNPSDAGCIATALPAAA